MTLRRRWIAAGLGVVAALAVWLFVAFGPWRGGKLSPERLVPLASELEGIRGIYLYYGVPGTDSLAAEYRDIVVKDRPADRVRAIYRELVAGSNTHLESPFPEGVELLNAYYTSRGSLYLDWNRALVQGFHGGTEQESQILRSILLTAADNLPDVQEVEILVEGSPIETIGGHFDAMRPMSVQEWR
jgi:Sporulation and spore germination